MLINATTNAGHIFLKSPFDILKIKKATLNGNNAIRINDVHLLKTSIKPIIISKTYKAGKYAKTATIKSLVFSGMVP